MWSCCVLPISVTPLPGFTDLFSAITHLSGIAVFTALAPGLVSRARGHGPRLAVTGLLIFAVLFMFSMSSVYHLLPQGSAGRGVMLRLDHAGIFVLIASTVTVPHTVLFRGLWRWGPIAFSWLAVASMVPLKAVFLHSMSGWANSGVYIGLGIPGSIAMAVIVRRLGWRTCTPLLLGGLCYIVGALFNQLSWPKLIPGVMHAHELFHLFVIGGVAFHWRFAWLILAEPVPGAEAKVRSEPCPTGPTL